MKPVSLLVRFKLGCLFKTISRIWMWRPVINPFGVNDPYCFYLGRRSGVGRSRVDPAGSGAAVAAAWEGAAPSASRSAAPPSACSAVGGAVASLVTALLPSMSLYRRCCLLWAMAFYQPLPLNQGLQINFLVICFRWEFWVSGSVIANFSAVLRSIMCWNLSLINSGSFLKLYYLENRIWHFLGMWLGFSYVAAGRVGT
jgi:hypothetical protein